MKKGHKLLLFTQSFPYGKGESFIDDEMDMLCATFDKVYVFPLYAGAISESRSVPSNCTVQQPAVQSTGITRIWKGIFNWAAPFTYLLIFFREVFLVRKIAHIKNLFLAILHGRIMLSHKVFKQIYRELDAQDSMYFYWATGSSYLLPGLRTAKPKVFVKFHRGDLYEDINGGYLPFRTRIFEKIDGFIFISKHGLSYFRSKYAHYLNPSNHTCIYLGTKDYHAGPVPVDSQQFTIITCSFVHQIKRVDQIFLALNSLQGLSMRWIHIGDGVDMQELKRMVSKAGKHLQVELLGYKEASEIPAIYKNNPTHLFINFSASEGLPVSIMEAISFGIPVLATDVGGTAEIVNAQTGLLLQADATVSHLASAIKNCLIITNFDRQYIRQYWIDNFSFEKNSLKLRAFLLSISIDD